MSGFSILKLTLLLISMLTIMAGTPVAPTLPKLAAAFAGEPHAELLSRLVLTMPALFTVIGAPLAGVVADRFGRRPLALVALLLYAVAGTSGFFGQTLTQILIGRAFLGLAVGGCTTAATALITDYFRGRERADLLGVQAAFTTAGGVLFISLGGFLAEWGWRFPFLIYLVAAAIFFLALGVIREPVRHQSLTRDGSASGLPWALLAAVYVVGLVGHIGFFSIPVQMPFYLQRDFGIGGVGTGLVLSLATVFASLTSFNYGRIKRRLSYPAILTTLFSLMAASYVVVGTAPALWVLVAGMCITGIAAGMLIPTINNWVSDVAASHVRGRALGLVTTSIFLGQFLTPIVIAPVLARVPSGTFFWLLGCVLLGFGLLVRLTAPWLVRRTRRVMDGMAPEEYT
ncbi:MAG: MFS transporter [Porticoccaceae bacterium]|nr:MFS transporter [Porticoccaceae bacterium]